MKRLLLSIFLVAATNASPQESRAGTEKCNDSIEGYNLAVSEVSDKLKRYSRCLSGSQGRDDCSSEFRRLRSAQNDFETAVSNYEADCP